MKHFEDVDKAIAKHAEAFGVSVEVYELAVARHIAMKRIKAHHPYMAVCDCCDVVKASMITGAQAEPVHRV